MPNLPLQLFLSPSEVTRRFGVSRKALRVYEGHGLIVPLRDGSGWRCYGPAQLARLHQILVLKRLGLPLAGMRALLEGSLERLDAVLALQQTALVARREEIDRGLDIVVQARRRIACGEELSIDDLAALTQRTVACDRLTDEAWREIFEPLGRKHYTREQQERLRDNKVRAGAAHAFSAWPPEAYEIAADLEAASQAGDPRAPDARAAVGRWKTFMQGLTGEDPELFGRMMSLWSEALADPLIAPRMPVSRATFQFLTVAAKAAGAWPPDRTSP